MMLLTVAGQGLYMLAGPFIGRIYSPEQIGQFGLFITIWTLLALFACGLYDLAIPGAETDEEAQKLSAVSILVGSLTGVLCGGGLTIATAFGWFGLEIYPLWVGPMMTAGMLIQMWVLIAQSWAVRRDDVLAIGRANLIMNGSRGLFQVIGGLLSPLWAMLVAGEIAARAIQARRMASKGGPVIRFFRWKVIWEAITQNRNFPLVFGPAFALDSVATLLQTAMMGFLFGPAGMGQYFLMRRTLDLPVAFAFKSLSDLFFARQISLARDAPERMRPFFLRTGAMLAIVGIIGSLPILFWGRELFLLFYGPNWGEAGLLAALMVPAMVLNLAIAPVSRVFQLTTMAHLRIIPGIVNVGGSLIVLWLAHRYSLSLAETTAGVSLTIGLHYAVYFAAGYFVAGRLKPRSSTASISES